ncbi:sarcosine oxidasee (formaldehyde-forming) [Sarracenia purpurea var. burkii]
MFQTLAIKHGAVLKDNMKVEEIEREDVKGGILVCTENGESVFYWTIKDGHDGDFTIGGGFPSFASYGDPYVYGTTSLEFPGLIKISVHGAQYCDPERRTWAPGPVPTVLDSLKEWIRGRFGDRVDTTTPAMIQSCLYSMTPDEDFVIDFLGGEWGKEVVVAGGFSGHGFKMALAVGRMLADLSVSGETKVVELKHFELGRFERNPKGNTKDFGEFSILIL